MSENVRALEFYSGGLHVALRNSQVAGNVIQAFDWDQSACQVYTAFHASQTVRKIDISTVSASDLSSYKANLWLMSPSCQPYTVLNPMAKGAEDPRAKSFIHLMHNVLAALVKMGSQPDYLLVENVAGFEASSTRQSLLRVLDSLNYTTMELLLTPLQYGIPNSRLRYYLLAKQKPLAWAHTSEGVPRVWRHIPGQGGDWLDPRFDSDLDSVATIRPLYDFLDKSMSETLERELAVPDRILKNWGRLFDIVLPSQRRSCCFTRGYTKLVERAGSIVQMNEGLETSAVFDKFLEAQAREEVGAVQMLHPLRLRYFSPDELLRIFGFVPTQALHLEFQWPAGISMKTQYKLIGNSVNVSVVTKLIDYLFLS